MIILPPTTLELAYTVETVDEPDALHFRHARQETLSASGMAEKRLPGWGTDNG